MVAGEANPVEIPLAEPAETVCHGTGGARGSIPRRIFRRTGERQRVDRGGGAGSLVPRGYVPVGGAQRLRLQARAVEGVHLNTGERRLQPRGARCMATPPLSIHRLYIENRISLRKQLA